MQIERDSLGVREREPSDHRRLDPFQQDALLPVTGHGHVQANLVPTGPDVGAWFPLIVTGTFRQPSMGVNVAACNWYQAYEDT